jgi:hypothetical protein
VAGQELAGDRGQVRQLVGRELDCGLRRPEMRAPLIVEGECVDGAGDQRRRRLGDAERAHARARGGRQACREGKGGAPVGRVGEGDADHLRPLGVGRREARGGDGDRAGRAVEEPVGHGGGRDAAHRTALGGPDD